MLRVERVLAAPAVSAEVAASVKSLCDHVLTHFKDEEQSGFFQQVVEQAPEVAGLFYPAEPDRLESMVRGFLDETTPGPRAKAIVA